MTINYRQCGKESLWVLLGSIVGMGIQNFINGAIWFTNPFHILGFGFSLLLAGLLGLIEYFIILKLSKGILVPTILVAVRKLYRMDDFQK